MDKNKLENTNIVEDLLLELDVECQKLKQEKVEVNNIEKLITKLSEKLINKDVHKINKNKRYAQILAEELFNCKDEWGEKDKCIIMFLSDCPFLKYEKSFWYELCLTAKDKDSIESICKYLVFDVYDKLIATSNYINTGLFNEEKFASICVGKNFKTYEYFTDEVKAKSKIVTKFVREIFKLKDKKEQTKYTSQIPNSFFDNKLEVAHLVVNNQYNINVLIRLIKLSVYFKDKNNLDYIKEVQYNPSRINYDEFLLDI